MRHAANRGFPASANAGLRLAASLLILAAVLANVAFTALGSIFNYPDVLDEPAGQYYGGAVAAPGRAVHAGVEHLLLLQRPGPP